MFTRIAPVQLFLRGDLGNLPGLMRFEICDEPITNIIFIYHDVIPRLMTLMYFGQILILLNNFNVFVVEQIYISWLVCWLVVW